MESPAGSASAYGDLLRAAAKSSRDCPMVRQACQVMNVLFGSNCWQPCLYKPFHCKILARRGGGVRSSNRRSARRLPTVRPSPRPQAVAGASMGWRLALRARFFLFCLFVPRQLVLADCDSAAICDCPDAARIETSYRTGLWFVVETANFQICCDDSEACASLARHAETLRAELR